MYKLSRGKAILAINPNAEYVIKNETINNYEIEWVNNTQPISDAEINIKLSELQSIEDNKQEAKEEAKASALAKLSALGLTEEEVQAIIK
jgi:hypothetical protein